AFQQLPELRAQLGEIDSAPVQKLRETMGEFTELRELLERVPHTGEIAWTRGAQGQARQDTLKITHLTQH
ncbi:hypothetical protein EOL34_27340, partial [Enterobacter hormaechei]